jgi:hypothetical protein
LIKHVLNLENVLCFARIRATRLGEGFRIRTVSDIHGVVAMKKCANEISKNGFLVCFFFSQPQVFVLTTLQTDTQV